MPSITAMVKAAAISLSFFVIGTANAQPCLLANPSFEVGNGLDGWNWFGDVVVDPAAAIHGSRGVSIGGPNEGVWSISAVWQARAATPGAQFEASVHAGHSSSDPLNGSARAILNIEWRDGADQLISYESHDLLTAADPTGQMVAHTVMSGPAPAGTVTTRLLLATLQSPANEPGRAVFDLVDFIEQTTPSYDDQQWGDFQGGRVIQFAGHSWRVKGDGYFGPGPNWFSDSTNTVQLINDGKLQLAIRGTPGNWSSSEVTLEDPLGYGDYVFTSNGRLDLLAPNAVLGLFLWQYPPCYESANTWNQHNEIDVEISRWGNPSADTGQFVVQPYNAPGNITRFDIDYAADDRVSYAFNWLPDRIEYRIWRGGPNDESPGTMITTWDYTGQHLPRPEQPRVHINLWHTGEGPSNSLEQFATIEDFVFKAFGACLPDLNDDGFLDSGDIGAFVGFFLSGDLAVDFNGDGFLDSGDIACFITAYLDGC